MALGGHRRRWTGGSVVRRIRLAIAVVVALGLVAGCSSQGGDGSASSGESGDSGASGGSAPGVTDTEIHIGAVLHEEFFGDGRVGAEARIARANADGGVHGRQIVVDEWLDDGGDPTANADAMRRLVDQVGVFAVAPALSAATTTDFLADRGVPHFGWGISTDWCTPVSFGIAGGSCPAEQLPETWDFGDAVEQAAPDGSLEGDTLTIVGEDNDQARVAVDGFASNLETHGAAEVVTDSTIPTPPTVVNDYSPFVASVMDADPAAVVLVSSAANTLGMINGLKQAGYEGQIFNFVAYDPRLVGSAEGVYTILQGVVPYESADEVPAIQQVIDDVTADDPDTPLTQPVLAGYLSVDLLIAALENAGPELTRESLVSAADDGFSYDFGGAAGELTYPRNHTYFSGCHSVVRGTGTEYEVVVPLACPPLVENPNFED